MLKGVYHIIFLISISNILACNERNKTHSENFDSTGESIESFSNVDLDSLNLENGKRLYMLYCSGCHNLYQKKMLLYKTQKIPIPYFQEILIDTTKSSSDSIIIKHVKFFDLLTPKEIKEIKGYLDYGGTAKGSNL